MERLLTPTEVAEFLGVTLQHVYKMAGQGTLPCVQHAPRGFLRFRRDHLQAWIDNNSHGTNYPEEK